MSPRTPRRRHGLPPVARVLSLAAVLLTACDGRPAATPSTASGPDTAPRRLQVEAFHADYQADPAAADASYLDRRFIVIGRLQRVEHAGPEGTVVGLKAAHPDHPVLAELAARQPCGAEPATDTCDAATLVGTLPRGAQLYLDCLGGKTETGQAVLRDCLRRTTLPPATP